MIFLTTFIVLPTYFNILQRGTNQDSPRFCFGVCVCVCVRLSVCVFIKEVGIGHHVSKSSARIYN